MLTHRFFIGNTPNQSFWAYHAFKDVYSLDKLQNNLQKLAFPKDPSDLNGHDPLSMILGDGWEGFGEIFFKVFGLHPDVRVSKLVVSPPGQQGFDFEFTHSQNLRNGTIQAKYIGKGKAWEEELRESENMKLERCLKASQNEAGVSVDDDDNIIVFTNAKDIHYFTADVLLYDKVRCIGRSHIKYVTDQNPAFWDKTRELIMQANPNIKF